MATVAAIGVGRSTTHALAAATARPLSSWVHCRLRTIPPNGHCVPASFSRSAPDSPGTRGDALNRAFDLPPKVGVRRDHSCPIGSGTLFVTWDVGCPSTPHQVGVPRPNPNPARGYRGPVDLPELLVADVAEWRSWLNGHHSKSQGVWLVLAKKSTTHPTTLSYAQALDEAICFGWIDGQLGRRDNETFRRRFTPRSVGSPWSRRNVAIAEGLSASGRMHRSGEDQVRQAKADGRWNAAYAGQATAEVPEDLAKALIADPRAQKMFQMLTSANRYSILYRIGRAKKAETRRRLIDQFVETLARGETIHPQSRRSPD